jgi:hypothetical protein
LVGVGRVERVETVGYNRILKRMLAGVVWLIE